MKYAIKAMLAKDDWIYLTEDTGRCDLLVPMLYSNIDQARNAAKIWEQNRGYKVKVVEYNC